jgi:hypothetical protein
MESVERVADDEFEYVTIASPRVNFFHNFHHSQFLTVIFETNESNLQEQKEN